MHFSLLLNITVKYMWSSQLFVFKSVKILFKFVLDNRAWDLIKNILSIFCCISLWIIVYQVAALIPKYQLFTSLFGNLRTVCPACHRTLPIRRTGAYLLHGTNHKIICPHCNHSLQPQEEPIPFTICYMVGFALMVVPMIVCLYYLHLGFLLAVGISSIFVFIGIFIASLITLHRLNLKDRQ